MRRLVPSVAPPRSIRAAACDVCASAVWNLRARICCESRWFVVLRGLLPALPRGESETAITVPIDGRHNARGGGLDGAEFSTDQRTNERTINLLAVLAWAAGPPAGTGGRARQSAARRRSRFVG